MNATEMANVVGMLPGPKVTLGAHTPDVAARVEVGQPALQLDHEQIIRVGLGFIQDRLAGRAVNPSESDLGDHTDALRH